MTELVLKNRVNKKKIDSILLFLKTLNIDAEVKRRSGQKINAHEHNGFDPFAEVRGIWADRDIDGRKLRNEAWNIQEA
jgi:hypothetical protein